MSTEYLQMEQQIVDALKTIYDPEIPVNIYDLGLIYEIHVEDNGNVRVVMTLTSPNCPVAESLPEEVYDKVLAVPGVKGCELNLTFDPPWTKDMLSDEALLELGLL
ncbi:FeS assembly SUF system protein [Breznakibacter xylanolyticus]|uniref:FeS assembly SUF system protein n=1 Tax=Breznakibacter xylanolyticus TaxID=990 RepID=A0A2W7NKG6_9BACT|nr:SUF system Fe-S cluster assembly protein [Breznakibacter xylanolyticus]MBN2744737.1 SUF system Fe-S cluster assembly protein [Marinilabiliaceae bacterium]PZX18587.1 FeS assembly SUF system protein [Breznakibacter xylanolyticus]